MVFSCEWEKSWKMFIVSDARKSAVTVVSLPGGRSMSVLFMLMILASCFTDALSTVCRFMYTSPVEGSPVRLT